MDPSYEGPGSHSRGRQAHMLWAQLVFLVACNAGSCVLVLWSPLPHLLISVGVCVFASQTYLSVAFGHLWARVLLETRFGLISSFFMERNLIRVRPMRGRLCKMATLFCKFGIMRLQAKEKYSYLAFYSAFMLSIHL